MVAARIPCSSQRDARELALRLRADGYRVTRRGKLVIARTDTPGDAVSLAERLQRPLETDRSHDAGLVHPLRDLLQRVASRMLTPDIRHH